MNKQLLSPEQDPMGAAISEYYYTGKAGKLRVFSSQFEEDEIPVAHLFRSAEELPLLEYTALELAKGNILDAGAGSGCHSLALQDMGKTVSAIDISPLSVDVMKARNVKDVRQVNLFDERFAGSFDTILMLMNGSGIIGRLENFPGFYRRMKQLLAPGGSLLMDSSDLRYLFEDDDGTFPPDSNGGYYGEIDYRMKYKQIDGPAFDWLYIDFTTLSLYAGQNGFRAELIREGSHYDYLARLTSD